MKRFNLEVKWTIEWKEWVLSAIKLRLAFVGNARDKCPCCIKAANDCDNCPVGPVEECGGWCYKYVLAKEGRLKTTHIEVLNQLERESNK